MNVAGIDIGTNSVRLLIVDENLQEITREMAITRLGAGVDQHGALAPDAMKRTLLVLEDFGRKLQTHQVRQLKITATSAARDASNRSVFFREVQGLIGQAPELISGEEEAKLSFSGATADLDAKDGPFLIFDIGGGSTEFALGEHRPESYISVDMGGVRMTERFLKTDPPIAEELENQRQFVRSQLQRVAESIQTDRAKIWLGLAGTATSCAAWAAKLTTYDATVTHGFVLVPAQVRGFLNAVAGVATTQRRSLLVNPKRADVIVGGALVLDTIVEFFGVEQIVVSEKDILDGLAASALAQITR